jgi:protein TonB
VDVTDVIRDRGREPAGLERMAIISVLAHLVLGAILLFAPGGWLSRAHEPPKTVMTISLSGGNGGPNNGGMTSIGGRAVQAETPPEPKRPEPVTVPAVKTPEMVVPIPTKAPPKAPAKPTPAPVPAKPVPAPPVVKQAPADARGRTPTKGAETREGSTLAETGARGQGFGLSTSGGVGAGLKLDVQNFCCPDYLALMSEKIRANWDPHAEVPGTVIVKYTIQRDGTLVDASIEKPSGYTALDINAFRAVLTTRQLPPLPAAFPNPSLTVHLNFQYTR